MNLKHCCETASETSIAAALHAIVLAPFTFYGNLTSSYSVSTKSMSSPTEQKLVLTFLWVVGGGGSCRMVHMMCYNKCIEWTLGFSHRFLNWLLVCEWSVLGLILVLFPGSTSAYLLCPLISSRLKYSQLLVNFWFLKNLLGMGTWFLSPFSSKFHFPEWHSCLYHLINLQENASYFS